LLYHVPGRSYVVTSSVLHEEKGKHVLQSSNA
jgi:hypothetical protein